MKRLIIFAIITATLFMSTCVVAQSPLTADNNVELAAMLKLENPHDDKIKAFAEKYEGQVIAFDGCTAYVDLHGNYKTRFDYLIYVGNYEDKANYGPHFKFEDVSYYDLKLTGENIPDSFGEGLNIHILAEVGPYNQEAGIFILNPVSISMRGAVIGQNTDNHALFLPDFEYSSKDWMKNKDNRTLFSVVSLAEALQIDGALLDDVGSSVSMYTARNSSDIISALIFTGTSVIAVEYEVSSARLSMNSENYNGNSVSLLEKMKKAGLIQSYYENDMDLAIELMNNINEVLTGK